jgi:CheY-like chemotaxis protein
MPVGDFYSPRSFKVLLAEDIEANARLAILRLEQQGHRVTWVKNGQEAVEAFKIGGFDLILMDLQMPVLDGLDATRQIRRLEADNNSDHLPILALTASVLEQEREQCTLAGMDAVVNKPININELLEKMEKLTPVGAGTPRVAIIPVVPAQTSIDFSGLAGVADYAKGLETWRDALVYAEALRNFAVEHAEDALQILQLNTEGENNFTAMHRLLHTLKGLSGNLALSAIHTLSSELDAEVKAGNPQNLVERLGALDTAIKTAVAATRSLQMPPAVPVENSKRLASVEHVSGILHSLLSALDTLNPENAAPLLQQLSASLEAADFNSLQRQIDHFDFAGAKLTVENLIARYPKEKQRDAT